MATALQPAWQQLLAFVRVVEAGSFAEAARRAGTTTSAMSKAIGRFESTHGVRLLHRSTHALSLTGDGERLLEDARQLLRGVERLEAGLGKSGPRQAAGRVRISAPRTFASSCLIPFVGGLRTDHPDIDLEILCDNQIADLAGSGIDLALRAGQVKGIPGHLTRTLFTFPWIACAAASYVERRGSPATPADLADHDQVTFLNAASGQVHCWEFRAPDGADTARYRHHPDTKLVLNDGTAAWSMIVAGFGIGWAPSWLAAGDLRSGRVVEVLRDWRTLQSSVSIVRLDQTFTPKRIDIVIERLVAAAPEWRSLDANRAGPHV